MLLSLHVKNLALIDETEVEFGEGLNILTGETGAGKSVIIGSINLALGKKVMKDMLREQSKTGLVELIFKVEHDFLRQRLSQLEIDLEDDIVIMSRKITANKSVCRINSETVKASKMNEVAALLIDIHGQHEHQSLLNSRKHLEILDEYAKEAIGHKKEDLRNCYQEYTTINKEMEQAISDESGRARELALLEFEIQEIENADLKEEEDKLLETEYRKMSNGKKIAESLGSSHYIMSESESSVSNQIGRSLRELLKVAEFDEQLNQYNHQLIDIDNLVNDFNREIRDYLNETDFEEESFTITQNRLDEINHLKAKYGDSIKKILNYKMEKEARYENLKNYEEYIDKLSEKLKEAEIKLSKSSQSLSNIRKKFSKKLVKKVKEALIDLNFLDVKFDMEFKEMDHFTANGIDLAEFMISTNPGEPLRPLKTVASGGELSRIMLALKTILAENDVIDTLIFDEIDSGISGRTAQMVAEKMNIIGKNRQVICITHLPQIASMADHHFLIQKSVISNSTISNIDKLSQEESVMELARMIGGVKITDTVVENAKEMKELALSVKNSQT